MVWTKNPNLFPANNFSLAICRRALVRQHQSPANRHYLLFQPAPPNYFLIRVKKLTSTVKIPFVYSDSSLSYLKNISFNELIDVEYQATARAFAQNQRPNLTITIDSVDESNLGQLLMLFEGATAFLGEWFGVNAFNQPGVELSKNLTKDILCKKQ